MTTAAAQARGEIGIEHVTVIRDFMAQLPPDVDPGTRAAAESQLAQLAGGLTPKDCERSLTSSWATSTRTARSMTNASTRASAA